MALVTKHQITSMDNAKWRCLPELYNTKRQ